MEKPSAVKILEQCMISPPPNSTQPTALPLTFFDIPWLFFSPAQPLFFYEYPFSTSYFLSTTLPRLKHSLTLTLQHFFPFAANLTLPQACNGLHKPHIVYSQGNYVSLTIAEWSSLSNDDHGDYFNHLSGNHQRSVDDFYSLVPHLESSGKQSLVVPLLAVQITVFSSVGMCIGLAFHHVVADGRTFNHFMKTWASFCRDHSSCLIKSLPFYDRLVIKDANGLEGTFFTQWCKRKSSQEMLICKESNVEDSSNDKVLATLVVSPTEMEKIKQWIVLQCKKKNRSKPTHLSPSNLTCAFVWVCRMKAEAVVNEKFSLEEVYYFGFNAGVITRLEYPVPTTYFGNCVGFARCMAIGNELLGEDGIIVAAEVIGNKVKELDKAILGGAENWILEYEVFFGSEAHVMIAGSPKLDFYETDFGWGRPRKIEEISVDSMRAISFTESRYVKGGIEVGLALPKPKMDAFISIFNEGLKLH